MDGLFQEVILIELADSVKDANSLDEGLYDELITMP